MRLELLCLTMLSRGEFLRRLILCLAPQMAGRSDVFLRIKNCDPSLTLGENRDQMLKSATGDYVAFVDDDDLVSDDYISSIMPLLDGVDQIGFELQCYIDGKPLDKVTHHTLRAGGWYEDEKGYWRDISHVNPMRRELVLLEPFEGGHGEDQRWADRLRGKVKTEHHIPRVLYHYYFRTRKNMGGPCPKCGSTSTVLVEIGTHCNSCSHLFDGHPIRKSCLWT